MPLSERGDQGKCRTVGVCPYQIVYTRAFEAPDGSGDLKLLPMADYFNHGTQTELEMMYDQDGNFFCQTSYDVPAGTPLRMSYGDPTNPSFLFARYGFLDQTAPVVFCKLFPPHINQDMIEPGYAQNRMLFGKDGSISPEVFDILLYMSVSLQFRAFLCSYFFTRTPSWILYARNECSDVDFSQQCF